MKLSPFLNMYVDYCFQFTSGVQALDEARHKRPQLERYIAQAIVNRAIVSRAMVSRAMVSSATSRRPPAMLTVAVPTVAILAATILTHCHALLLTATPRSDLVPISFRPRSDLAGGEADP